MKVLTHFAEKAIDYDGSQIHSLWANREFGLKGDCIVAFAGKCDVKPEFMVDVEDLKAGAKIFSRKMLHFIVEHFDHNLEAAVMRQRMLVTIAKECIDAAYPNLTKKIYRVHDDLFTGDAKMSVSIATATPVSTKIHLGINIIGAGAPVKAAGLEELGIDAAKLARAVMEAYAAEMRSAYEARCKVRGVE
jgi:hypothetical protein